ncbi:MAG TPA: FecR family protein [Parasegetibacter sp.]
MESTALHRQRGGVEYSPFQDSEFKPYSSGKRWVITAAIALGALGAAAYFFWDKITGNSAADNEVALQKLATETGQRKLVQLAPGANVWLSPKSELDYPVTINGDTLKVYLKGEAYFEVLENVAPPMIIYSGGLETHASSANFTVQAYDNQSYVAVTVVKGTAAAQVSREDKDNSTNNHEYYNNSENASKGLTNIETESRIVFIKESKELITQRFPRASHYMDSRRKGVYKFWGLPPTEIIKELERQYPDRFELEGDFQNCKFYGELRVTDPVEKFLKRFAENVNATLKNENGVWVIKGKGCEALDK